MSNPESDAKANWPAEDADNLNLALKMSLMTLAPEKYESGTDDDSCSEMPGLMLSSSDDEDDGSDSEVYYNLIKIQPHPKLV